MILSRLFLRFPNSEHALFDVTDVANLSTGIWSLTGKSGVGKTSLLRLLSGWFDDEDREDIAWKAELDWNPLTDVDFIGNESSLLPWKRVAANIHLRVPAVSTKDIESIVKATGLEAAVLHAWPYELSLGMYKRVEFAAALLGGRQILLLDEFFGSLDPESRHRCFDLVHKHRANKVTIISTHSPETLPEDGMRSITLQRTEGQPTITKIQLGDTP